MRQDCPDKARKAEAHPRPGRSQRISGLALWRRGCCALVIAVSACSNQDPTALLASAQQRLDRDDVAGAVIDAKNALQADAQLAAGRFMLGKALLMSGDVSGAETELRRAQEFGHPESELAPVLADLLLAKRSPEAVIQQFGSLRFTDEHAMAEMRTRVAVAYGDMGELENAGKALTEALQFEPQHTAALILSARLASKRGDDEAARKVAADLLTRLPQDANVLLLQGDVLAQDANAREPAMAAYRSALAQRPRLLQAHANLITLLLAQGDLPAAAAQAAAMAKALPRRPQADFYQALVAFMQNDFVRVRELTQRLLRAAPDSPQVLYLAGVAELRLGALVQAETLLTRAVLAQPNGVEPRRELAALYVRLARPAAALETLRPMLQEAAPGDSSSWRVAGQAHALAGDFRKADAAFARAARLRPDDARVKVELGKSLIARGQVEPGLRELQAAMDVDGSGSDAALALISAHLRRRDTAAALKAVQSWADKQPGLAAPELMRGRIQLKAGDAKAARQAFEAALAKDPDFVPAMVGLADADIAEQHPEEARKRYEALLKRNPKSSLALLAMAELARRTDGNSEAAAQWVDKAVQANPQDTATWQAAIAFHRQAGDNVAALARARSAMAAKPNDPILLMQVADAQLAERDVQQAISSLNRVVQLLPRSAEGWHRLAEAQLVAGNLSAARQDAAKAIELAPEWVPGLRTGIAVALRENRAPAALAMVRAIQGRQPTLALGWQLEGELEARQGHWGPAVVAFKRAMGKAESTGLALQLHAALVSGGVAVEAQALEQGWLQAHPDDVLFIIHLADSALAREDWKTAASRYRQALDLQTDVPALLNNLAYALLRQGDSQALAIAQRAVAALPFSPEVIDTLAQAHAADRQWSKAIEWQARAVELAPQTPKFRLELARMHLEIGDRRKARQELERLQRMNLAGENAEQLRQLLQQTEG